MPRSADAAHSAFRAVQAAFQRACDTRPAESTESEFLFGGRRVVVRVAGRALASQLTGAFEHLQAQLVSSYPLSLTVELWDQRATGVVAPSIQPAEAATRSWTVEGGRLTALGRGRFVRFESSGAATWLDRATNQIVGWRSSAEGVRLSERSKPLPVLLPLWYRSRGIDIVHAGLVALDGRGVMVAGPSGSGKSTVSLACLRNGWSFLADDQCGVEERRDGVFVGHSLYSTGRLERDHLRRFSSFEASTLLPDRDSDDKAVMMLARTTPDRVVVETPISAIALPRFDPTRCGVEIRSASQGESLRRIALSTLFVALGSGAAGFDRLTRLVGSVPIYWLEFGPGIETLAAHLEGVAKL